MLGRNPLSQLPPRNAGRAVVSQSASAAATRTASPENAGSSSFCGSSSGDITSNSVSSADTATGSAALQCGASSGAPQDAGSQGVSSSSASAPRFAQTPIVVERITVERDRLVCEVCIPDPRFRYSSVNLAILVKAAYPDIVRHACINEVSNRFADVIETTSVPHMLEHLAIDEQIHASATAERLVGATEWTCEQKGQATIQLAFADDLEALRAFKRALSFLNKSLVGLAR